MDVIALHRAGFTNALATLGTALTSEQARILARYAEKIYICYDSDEAGQRATKKAIDILGAAGLDTKIVKINGAKDPDEFIAKFGKAAFEKLLENSDGHIDYKLGVIRAKYDLTQSSDMLRFVKEACEMLSAIPSRLEQEIFVKELAHTANLSEEVIRSEVNRIFRARVKAVKTERVRQDINKSLGYKDALNPDRAKNPGRAAKEESLVGILLLRPEYLTDKTLAPLLSPELFTGDLTRKIYEAVSSAFSESDSFDISAIGESLTADEMGAATGMLYKRKKLEDNSISVALVLAQTLLQKDSAADIKEPDDDELRKIIEKRREQKK